MIGCDAVLARVQCNNVLVMQFCWLNSEAGCNPRNLWVQRFVHTKKRAFSLFLKMSTARAQLRQKPPLDFIRKTVCARRSTKNGVRFSHPFRYLTKILLIIKIIKIIIYSILSFFSLKVPVYPLLHPTATLLKFFVYQVFPKTPQLVHLQLETASPVFPPYLQSQNC